MKTKQGTEAAMERPRWRRGAVLHPREKQWRRQRSPSRRRQAAEMGLTTSPARNLVTSGSGEERMPGDRGGNHEPSYAVESPHRRRRSHERRYRHRCRQSIRIVAPQKPLIGNSAASASYDPTSNHSRSEPDTTLLIHRYPNSGRRTLPLPARPTHPFFLPIPFPPSSFPSPPCPLSDTNVSPSPFPTSLHETAFIFLICLAQLLMLASLAQALLPAPLIALSFPSISQGDVTWFSASYSLTCATFVLPSGRLGDLFGCKPLFIAGYLWFGFWSLFAGITPFIAPERRVFYFCVTRALQGIGPAMLVPNGMAMVGRVYSVGSKRKRVVMCLVGASAPVGFVLGGVVSCAVAGSGGRGREWAWAGGFWILAVVCWAAAAGGWLMMPGIGGRRCGEKGAAGRVDVEVERSDGVEEEWAEIAVTVREGDSVDERKETLWAKLDATGMIIGMAGLILLNFPLNQAPLVGWHTPYTYFTFILGLIFVFAFVWHERSMAACPLIPIKAMTAQATFVLVCTATGWASFSIWIYYTVYLLENLRGWSPLPAAVSLVPAPVTGLIASLLAGYLMGKVGAHWVMLVSMGAFFVGSLLMATVPVEQTYWGNTFWAILIMPFVSTVSELLPLVRLGLKKGRRHGCCCVAPIFVFPPFSCHRTWLTLITGHGHEQPGSMLLHIFPLLIHALD
ncbi:hypothetical protein B0T14DRAFT_320012 [Immersiella caudata]|uniref:Major facilitator superfamily (MFS) profile domain-containing protein n=1 Tax=Immersiella caudata TaxID=314043 RepID=A0AA39WBX5_9PEZI|nr:hypothetical protein B0T14DRAFT_320012 [Immersiella caudata]